MVCSGLLLLKPPSLSVYLIGSFCSCSLMSSVMAIHSCLHPAPQIHTLLFLHWALLPQGQEGTYEDSKTDLRETSSRPSSTPHSVHDSQNSGKGRALGEARNKKGEPHLLTLFRGCKGQKAPCILSQMSFICIINIEDFDSHFHLIVFTHYFFCSWFFKNPCFRLASS